MRAAFRADIALGWPAAGPKRMATPVGCWQWPAQDGGVQGETIFFAFFGDVPKNINDFTLKYARPIAKGIKVKQ